MRAYEKKKFYRQFCARQLRKGLTASAADGTWGKQPGVPASTANNLLAGCHPYAKRNGE